MTGSDSESVWWTKYGKNFWGRYIYFGCWFYSTQSGQISKLSHKKPKYFVIPTSLGIDTGQDFLWHHNFQQKDIETLMAPESWITGNMVDVFTMLLNQGNTFAVDTNFVPMLSMAVHLKSIPNFEAFLEHYFQIDVGTMLSKLQQFKSVLITNFNNEWRKAKNNTVVITGYCCSSQIISFLNALRFNTWG